MGAGGWAFFAVLVAVASMSMHQIYTDFGDDLPGLVQEIQNAIASALDGDSSAAAGASRSPPPQQPDDDSQPGLFRVVGGVDRIPCDLAKSDASCAEAVARSRVPMVLTGTCAASWPALAKWKDPGYLSSVVDELNGVRVSAPGMRVFTPGQGKDDGSQLPDSLGRHDSLFETVNTTMASFLAEAGPRGTPRGRFRFFSGVLSSLESPQLLDDIEPTLPFSLMSDHLATLLWISQAGSVSNTHYDRSVNFVAQVVGRKRWLLFPPAETPRLYPYPSVHRHYHQSRVNISHPDAPGTFPGSEAAEAFQVTLEPGEVLFVPPYYAHLVESLDFSVGVSMVTPSAEEIHYGEARWHPAPFDVDWNDHERARGVAYYVRRLVFHTEGTGGDAHDFIKGILIEGRWRHFRAGIDAAAEERGVPEANLGRCRAGPKGLIKKERQDELNKCAKDVSAKLNEIPDPDIRATALANLIEELSRYAVGGPLRILDFLETCF